jgi:hypothetical protein
MNAQVLIDSIVRQVTVLIAQLATSGGIRAPLAHVANQVFLDLAGELAAQGVSRKISADMFGMALRAYIRKVRRLSEAQTDRGRTLWQSVLDFVRSEELVSRDRVLERFRLDGELEVSSILHDLTESGLVFCSGSGKSGVYRAATDDELGRLTQLGSQAGLEEMAWVLIYRNGRTTSEELATSLRTEPARAAELVERLLQAGRIQVLSDGAFVARDFVVELGASIGWEAAVFDHVQAVVQTICQRLRQVSFDQASDESIGGSTYSFDVWPGHPLQAEVQSQLARIRTECGELRRRVEHHNASSSAPPDGEQVVLYVGQCVLDRELEEEDDENEVTG